LEPEKESASPSRNSLRPLALLGILVVASWFRSKSKGPIQHSVNANSTENDARDNRNTRQEKSTIPLRVVVEALPPAQPPEQEREAREKRKEWCAWGNLVIQGLVLAAVIAYACITHRQWKEMQEQTRIQRNTGINTERAWVGLDVPITLDRIETQSTSVAIKGHYSIKNFGHGPAFKVMQSGNFIQQTNLEMEKREADFYCDSSVKFATGTVPVGGEMKQPPPFGYTLFPSQGKDYPIEYQGGTDTLRFLQFVGCVAYTDQFKTVHWTRFCMERRPGDTSKVPKLDFCALYNDTDEPKD
jgi:hypothetical protein